MNIRQAIDEFLSDHKARGSRPKTIDWYGKTLDMLLQEVLAAELKDLTVFTVNRVMNAAQGRGVKPASLAAYDRALRGFCNWLYGVGVLAVNPFDKRKRPKERWTPKQVLTPAELEALFHVARQDKRFACRHHAVLCLFLECGLRASEVARLKLTDVNWETGVLMVTGKTGNGGVATSRRALKALRRYVTHERKGTAAHLFLYNRKPLTQAGLSAWVQRLADRAGITRPVGTHLLRHTFATHFLKAGGDAFTLQRILRHTSPAMTSRYLHFMTEDLKEQTERFSPLATLANF